MADEPRKPKIDGSAGLHSPLGVAISENDRATMTMVREALDARRVRLAWQPVVLASDPSRIAFHEGLIRVLEPGGRVIPARDFMAVSYTHLDVYKRQGYTFAELPDVVAGVVARLIK